jgi:hypothetical protein
MEIVPLRAGPATGATEKLMPPLPVPDVGPVKVIHDTPLAALQAHPDPVAIVAVPVPPCAPNECEGGSTVTSQPPPWVRVTS